MLALTFKVFDIGEDILDSLRNVTTSKSENSKASLNQTLKGCLFSSYTFIYSNSFPKTYLRKCNKNTETATRCGRYEE